MKRARSGPSDAAAGASAAGGAVEDGAVLVFHSRSAAAAPGMGAGESGGPPALAATLAAALAPYPDFRRVLSNFYRDAAAPLVVRGATYATAEHAFHALKLAPTAAAAAARFARGAPGYVGDDPRAAKRAGGARGLARLASAERDAWAAARAGALVEIWTAKFAPGTRARHVLKATRGAALVHVVRGAPRERWAALEALRDHADEPV